MSKFLQEQVFKADALTRVPTYHDNMATPNLEKRILQNIEVCYESYVRDFPKRYRRNTQESLPLDIRERTTSVLKAFLPTISFISYPVFMQAFTNMTTWLSIQDGLTSGYCLLLDSLAKSSCWLGNIAWDHLPTPATLQLDLNAGGSNVNESFEPSIVEMIQNGIKTFVYFDDAGYSGRQLEMRVKAFDSAVRRSNAEEIKLFMCVPYMSNKAISRLQAVDTERFRFVMYPNYDIIKNTSDIFQCLGLNVKVAEEIFNILYMIDYGYGVKELLESTMTFFEHKYPDEKSFPKLDCFKYDAITEEPLLEHQIPYKRPQEYTYAFPKSSRVPTCLLRQTAGRPKGRASMARKWRDVINKKRTLVF